MDPRHVRIQNAKQFLLDNPLERPACAARIYGLAETTLYDAIKRGRPDKSRGGHNKILEDYQVEALHGFIRSLLAHGVQPTHGLIFNAIKTLKRAQNPDFEGPSQRWFRLWWKNSNLHKIKTKPLAVVRYSAGQASDVQIWFDNYRRILEELKIVDKRNIINFDEAGFRVGCMKGHEIIVPTDVRELYAISPENRRSLTVFECINAAGDYPPPPVLVIQGHELMNNWFAEGLPQKTLIITSENGFTSDKIAIDFLNHYIANSDAGPNADWKLMLMDNHGSHCIPEFILLANENHIRPFPLIPHLTHCMQPLDVGIFQPYKHWHDVAIRETFANFALDYPLTQFCQDLTKIRNKTFQTSTIRSAFKKSGMWPIDADVCINQLKKFAAPNADDESVQTLHGKQRKRNKILSDLTSTSLPVMPRVQPKTFHDVQQGLTEWLRKLQTTVWSDPIRPQEFEQFIDHTKKIATESALDKIELELLHKRRSDELLHKTTSRKRLKSTVTSGGLTKEDAEQAIAAKQHKEEEAEKRKVHNNFMKMWRMERDQKHAEGVAARREEKLRVKAIKYMAKQGLVIPNPMLTPVQDPEALWKATDPKWINEEAKKDAAKRRVSGQREDGGTIKDEEDEEKEDLVIITGVSDNRRFIMELRLRML